MIKGLKRTAVARPIMQGLLVTLEGLVLGRVRKGGAGRQSPGAAARSCLVLPVLFNEHMPNNLVSGGQAAGLFFWEVNR